MVPPYRIITKGRGQSGSARQGNTGKSTPGSAKRGGDTAPHRIWGSELRRRNNEIRTHCAVLDRLRFALPTVAAATLIHVPNGEARSARTGALLKRLGTRPGAADLHFIWQGRSHWIEVKVGDPALGIPKTYQSPTQRAFEADVTAAGAAYGVARSSDEALALCREWGVPVREAAHA